MLVTEVLQKQGSKHVRRMLVQSCSCHIQNQEFSIEEILLKIQLKKGAKKAAVALARKILCILHHLLVNKEKYQKNGTIKSKPIKFDRLPHRFR